MMGPKSLEYQEKIEVKKISKVEDVLSRGERLVTHAEQKNEHLVVDVESLPNTIDKKPFHEKIQKLQRIKDEMKRAVLSASFLILTSGNALAENAPKDFDATPQIQEQTEVSPSPASSIAQTNVTLEIIKGVATIALEQKKKDVSEILQGVDPITGKEVSSIDRVGKASDMIPRRIPKLGNIALVISAVIDIQKEIAEAKPGYEKNILGRVARLIADIPSVGLASVAWDILSKREAQKNQTVSTVVTEGNPSEVVPENAAMEQ